MEKLSFSIQDLDGLEDIENNNYFLCTSTQLQIESIEWFIYSLNYNIRLDYWISSPLWLMWNPILLPKTLYI